jgi:hypothetical protein
MTLTCRPVSQQHWLAHGSARARAHPGWDDPRAREANCSWLSARTARSVDGGCVTRVGRFWMERARADQPPGINARPHIRSDPARRRRRPEKQSCRHAISSCRVLAQRVLAASSWETNPATDRRISRSPRPRTSSNKLFCRGSHNARNRSRVEQELALRPRFSPQARMPPTALRAPRGERRGLLVLTAGPARYSYGRTPPARWTRPNPIERAGVLALFLGHDPDRGTRRLEDHEADGTRFGSAQARRVDSRPRVAAAVAGN